MLLPGNALTASGESIIRHLQRSILARPWSSVVLTGALGHPAQLPQILRGFGHEDLVLTRGAADDAGSLGTVFWWQAPSGDRVRVSRPIIDLTAPPLLLSDHGPPTLHRHLRDLGLEGHALAHADQSALLLLIGEGHSDPAVSVAALRPLGLHASTPPDLADHVPALCGRLLLERCEPLDALTSGSARDELSALWRDLLAAQDQPVDSGGSRGLVRRERSSVGGCARGARTSSLTRAIAAMLRRIPLPVRS